ncbi:sialidase family protein [Nitrospira sp. NS4]|uniref:sialidase family protein n=1 Tax=Nitrospira sp. NS4 TaxID=3414498 RepID=UPI003C2B1987
MKMKMGGSIPWFVVLLLAFSAWVGPGPVAAQSSPEACRLIDALGLDKQINQHAHEILAACGRVPASAPVEISSAFSSSAPSNLGGIDQDVVLGGEGTYPHVTQSETQVWTEGNTSVVAYNDSRTAPTCYGGGSYSTDGGATWTNLNSRPFCSGHGTNYGDPVLVYDRKHTRWLAAFLATGCGGQGIGMWSSPDGITWSAGSCAHSGTSDDRESGWVDNNPVSPFYGRVYISWNNFAVANSPIFATYSDDGGVTWSVPVQVVANATFIRNVQLTTGPDGAVFIAGMNEGGGGLSPRLNLVYRSTNGGTSWLEFSMGSSFTPPGTSFCGYFAAMFPSYWRHMGWGDIGAGPGGVIHYAYAQGAAGDAGDIYYTSSTDNGATWSTAIRLNTDSGTRLQWQPSLSVSPAGHVFVSWYDARNTTGNAYERWGRVSNDNGLTWQTDDVISDAPSPLPLQPDSTVNSCYAGDYDRSFADGSAFFTAWVDGRVAISGVPQQDVYFDRVTDVPPHLILTATGFKQKGAQSANLSWISAIPGGNVDIKRDSTVMTTVPDSGVYTDNIGTKGNKASYVYQVCYAGTTDCSNQTTVKFGK